MVPRLTADTPRWTRSGVQAGAVLAAAAALALADVAVALSRQPPLDGDVPRTAAALALALCVLAAVPLALVLAAAARLVRRRRPTRRQLATLVGAGAALLTLVALLRFDLGEVDWHGVDPWLPGSLALAAAVYLAALAALARARRAAVFAVVTLVLVGVAAIAAFAGATPQARGEALAALDESSVVTRRLANLLAQRLDADGDGHPRLLCGPSCDCDDADAGVHPLADDIADNAVDEDCDGADRSGAEIAALEAELAPPPPRASSVPPPARARPPNVLLIVVDTLRADHLGAYGYARDTSPRLDAWARTAVVFEQARSTGPSTRFSVPPLMIGKYFTEIDRDKYEWPRIGEGETLLAERLDPLGYTSGAFHSIRYLRPFYRLDQGFDHYSDKSLDDRGPPLRMTSSDYITDEALAWVDKAQLKDHQPFLLWAYYGDPHSQYMRHDGFKLFSQNYRDLYDHEILFTDHHIGRLFDGLAERGLTDDLIIVFTSDHGEALDPEVDHGTLNHSRTLYDELIHVPLIISGPGVTPRRVSTPVSLVDVVPTMLELVGLPHDPALRGVSLAPWLRGEDPVHPPVFFEKHRALDDPQKGMIAWPYKVILTVPTGHTAIYDLAADPAETRNVAYSLPEAERARLVNLIKHWTAHVLAPIHPEYRH